MKILILSLFTLNIAFAGKLLDTKILKVVDGTNEYSLAYGQDGRVYKVRKTESDTVGNITAILDEKNNWLYPLYETEEETTKETQVISLGQNYTPTDLKSLERAEELFSTMYRRAKKKSQCYMRAHAWAFDMYRDYNINSEKIFIFFNRRYIIKYDFEWWFHVAPAVRVNGLLYVMDRKYTSGPTEIKEWTDIFMRNDARCDLVGKYHPDMIQTYTKSDCFLRIVPMYFWQPLTINEHDNDVNYRTGWMESEITISKEKAFRNYPGF